MWKSLHHWNQEFDNICLSLYFLWRAQFLELVNIHRAKSYFTLCTQMGCIQPFLLFMQSLWSYCMYSMDPQVSTQLLIMHNGLCSGLAGITLPECKSQKCSRVKITLGGEGHSHGLALSLSPLSYSTFYLNIYWAKWMESSGDVLLHGKHGSRSEPGPSPFQSSRHLTEPHTV